MEIIGTALPGGWDQGYFMQAPRSKPWVWSSEVQLADGQVKFKGNGNWAFNWGGTTFPVGDCLANGPNILVANGRYRVELDLKEQKYQFTLIRE
jgi:hypothetical protein